MVQPIACKEALNRVPCLAIDDRLVLSVMDTVLVSDASDIDWVLEERIERTISEL